MNSINIYVNRMQLPKDLKNKVFEYFEYKNSKHNMNERQILRNVSTTLQQVNM